MNVRIIFLEGQEDPINVEMDALPRIGEGISIIEGNKITATPYKVENVQHWVDMRDGEYHVEVWVTPHKREK